MKVDNDFPHLFEFIQTNMAENTDIISPEVADELQTLIHSYEINKNSDMAKFLIKVQDLEEENIKMKDQVNLLNSNLKEGEMIHLNLKKSAMENKSALNTINEEYENKIMEFRNQIQTLKKENDYFNEQLEKKKNTKNVDEEDMKLQRQKIGDLEKENNTLTEKLKKELENNPIIINQMKEELNDKRKECENIRMNLQKINKEGMKLKKLNELLRATHKGNETVSKNLRRELKEEKDNHKLYIESSEKRFAKDDELILTLVNNIKQKNFDMRKVEELLEKFNKRKMVFEDSASIHSIHEEIQLNKSKLGNLEEYEKLFNSSMNSDIDEEVSDIEMDEMHYNNINDDKDISLIEDKEISMIEDKIPDDTLNINETMTDNGLEITSLKDSSFAKKDKPVHNKHLTTNDKVVLDKKKTDDNFTRHFQTNKEKILDDLNIQLADKVKFLTNVRPNINLNYEENTVNEGLQETIRDLKGIPKQYLLYDSNINEKDFLKAVEYLEEFLKGDTNSTTFKMNAHEKRTLIKRFKQAVKKNLENFCKVFFELFIGHIYYLENTISALTKDNSYKEIKEQNMKSEMEYLIQQFLKKNEKNQNLLNNTNNDFMKLKNFNKKKLEKHEIGRMKRQNEKLQEYVNEESEKNYKKPKITHTNGDGIKRKDRRYTRPVTKEDVVKLNNDKDHEKKKEEGKDGIWEKVTGWF